MAYMRVRSVVCLTEGCMEQGTHEVYDQHHVSYGRYCHRHAEKRVKQIQTQEDRELDA